VNVAPTANAGPDRMAWKGALVTLDGRESRDPEGSALTYAWRQLEGPAVALADDGTAQPSLVAPRATTTLRFALEVSDGQAVSAPDEVTVSVQNRAPTASAGADQVALLGHVVTLEAPDSHDPDGDPLAVTWFQRSGPPVVLAAQPGGSATFVAPATPSLLEFGLVVSDGEAISPEDGLRVQVLDPSANWPPVANAGADREVPRRSVVVLHGTGVDRELDPLTWSWVQLSGPSVALVGDDGPSPSFVAPAEEADLEFLLAVADELVGVLRLLVAEMLHEQRHRLPVAQADRQDLDRRDPRVAAGPARDRGDADRGSPVGGQHALDHGAHAIRPASATVRSTSPARPSGVNPSPCALLSVLRFRCM